MLGHDIQKGIKLADLRWSTKYGLEGADDEIDVGVPLSLEKLVGPDEHTFNISPIQSVV